MGRSLLNKLEYNPFTTADDKPRLYVRSQPKRQSQRLTRDSFWKIYNAAGELDYPCLQIAMGISLTTFMREADICGLLLSDNVEGDLLKKVIGKSKNQKGDAKAARLAWDVGNYDLLRQLLHRARELSMINRRCPYVISHWPKQKRLGKGKTHYAQVTPRRLITMFAEARELAGFTGDNPPVFHGVKSLAIKLATDAGYKRKTIQHASAHSSDKVQDVYLEGHDLPFDDVEIVFSASEIGGEFK
jgi:integrase